MIVFSMTVISILAVSIIVITIIATISIQLIRANFLLTTCTAVRTYESVFKRVGHTAARTCIDSWSTMFGILFGTFHHATTTILLYTSVI